MPPAGAGRRLRVVRDIGPGVQTRSTCRAPERASKPGAGNAVRSDGLQVASSAAERRRRCADDATERRMCTIGLSARKQGHLTSRNANRNSLRAPFPDTVVSRTVFHRMVTISLADGEFDGQRASVLIEPGSISTSAPPSRVLAIGRRRTGGRLTTTDRLRRSVAFRRCTSDPSGRTKRLIASTVAMDRVLPSSRLPGARPISPAHRRRASQRGTTGAELPSGRAPTLDEPVDCDTMDTVRASKSRRAHRSRSRHRMSGNWRCATRRPAF